MTVGGAEDTLLDLPDLRASHVAASESGRLFVLDAPGGVVRVVEADGRVGSPFGRKGRGPGELADPQGIDVDSDGAVVVSDGAKRSLIRWNADGTLMSEDPFNVFVWGDRLRVADQGVMMQARDMKSREFRENLVHVIGESDVVLANFTWPPTQPPTYPSCPGYGVESPPFFTPWLLWDTNGRHTAVVNSARFEIDVFDGDRLVRRIRREITPIAVTDDVIAERIETITIGVLGCTIPGAERARVLGYQPVLPVISAVSIGPDGRIWIRRSGAGSDAGPIDIVTIDGEYLGTLPAGSPFPVAFAGQDRIVDLSKDSLDVAVIRVYRVNGTD